MFGLNADVIAENSTRKVLLIEDDRMVSNLIKSFLEKSNFIVKLMQMKLMLFTLAQMTSLANLFHLEC